MNRISEDEFQKNLKEHFAKEEKRRVEREEFRKMGERIDRGELIEGCRYPCECDYGNHIWSSRCEKHKSCQYWGYIGR